MSNYKHRFLLHETTSIANGNRLLGHRVCSALCHAVPEDRRQEVQSYFKTVEAKRFYKLDTADSAPGEDVAGISGDDVRATVIREAQECYNITFRTLKTLCRRQGDGRKVRCLL